MIQKTVESYGSNICLINSYVYRLNEQYGFPGGNALVLRAILGREPRPLRQYF
jgi:hypothetical protein